MMSRFAGLGLVLACSLLVSACGGGGGGSAGGGGGGGGAPTPPPAPAPVSAPEASRLLAQATFGATEASIAAVRSAGVSAWLSQQTAMAPSGSHQTYVDNRLTQLRVSNPQAQLNAIHLQESFWLQAATGPDELRQRMKFALSEIFVISTSDANIDVRGAAAYYDMLGANAFGNFRQLLEEVSLHPMMGIYLTHLANQKEDPATARHPDENYAREVMQLMTIGLYRLNADGTVQTSSQGQPVPSYSQDDISNLAKVFTGFSWYSPNPNNNTFLGRGRDPNATVRPMIAYPAFHSTSAKTFLGASIPASSTVDAAGDLRIALDTLFNHPNVGPFISRQLIQRLVTSNPTPAYVGRVASVFNNNGSGVRGDLGAVARATLSDPEARDAASAAGTNYGKLREPVVRLANWMRAFGVRSSSGNWTTGQTTGNTSLGQAVLSSNSVFNFFRPGYSPPNTRVGTAGLVGPEFQIVDEVTTAGYLNTMQNFINSPANADVQSTYASETAIANDAGPLVDRVDLLLTYGSMSPTLRTRILEAVNAVAIPGGAATEAQIAAARLNRVKLAVFLTMASPEYITQR